jgi:hypothetical protein
MTGATLADKLQGISEDIRRDGHAPIRRLMVMKQWLAAPGRLAAFGIWAAAQAATCKAKGRAAGTLLQETRTLLADADMLRPRVNRAAATRLHARLHDFQNEFKKVQWASVRMVHDWNLLVIEEGLALYLWYSDMVSLGYDLAADYCRHYDLRSGDGLSRPSTARVAHIAAFTTAIEAMEKVRGLHAKKLKHKPARQ